MPPRCPGGQFLTHKHISLSSKIRSQCDPSSPGATYTRVPLRLLPLLSLRRIESIPGPATSKSLFLFGSGIGTPRSSFQRDGKKRTRHFFLWPFHPWRFYFLRSRVLSAVSSLSFRRRLALRSRVGHPGGSFQTQLLGGTGIPGRAGSVPMNFHESFTPSR